MKNILARGGIEFFGKTRDELRHIKKILAMQSYLKKKAGESVSYVLDGQAKNHILTCGKKGLIISKDEEIDYKDISIDLSYDPDDEEQVIITEPDDSTDSISVYKLLNGSLTDFLEQYSKDDIKNRDLSKKVNDV